jgi:hypothetical protein
MYSTYQKSITELRECGFAVVVFSPTELEGMNNIDIEDEMCTAALHLIDISHDPDFKFDRSIFGRI